MKIKMWCLIHKPKNRIIHVWSGDEYVIGFVTKKGLLQAITVDYQVHLEDDEEVKKIEFVV